MACGSAGPRIGRGAQSSSGSARLAHCGDRGSRPGRAALLAVWHDSQETRTGDIPHTARPYLDQCCPEVITADQTASLFLNAARKTVQEAVAEVQHSRLRSALRERRRQARMSDPSSQYKDAGYTRVQGWIDSSRNNLRTDTARRIADAALCTSPLAWRGR